MTFLSWIRLSCGLTLLSSGTISSWRPSTPPALLMASVAYLNWLSPFSPVAAKGPDSGSTYAMRMGSAGGALGAGPASRATITAGTRTLLGLGIVGPPRGAAAGAWPARGGQPGEA